MRPEPGTAPGPHPGLRPGFRSRLRLATPALRRDGQGQGRGHGCGYGRGDGRRRRRRSGLRNRFFNARLGLPVPTVTAGSRVQRGHARTNALPWPRVTAGRIRAAVRPVPGRLRHTAGPSGSSVPHHGRGTGKRPAACGLRPRGASAAPGSGASPGRRRARRAACASRVPGERQEQRGVLLQDLQGVVGRTRRGGREARARAHREDEGVPRRGAERVLRQHVSSASSAMGCTHSGQTTRNISKVSYASSSSDVSTESTGSCMENLPSGGSAGSVRPSTTATTSHAELRITVRRCPEPGANLWRSSHARRRCLVTAHSTP